jgi:uncharacterized protein (DUF4415 family)
MNTQPFPMPRARGRPRKDPSKVLEQVSIRLEPAHAEKLRALGGRRWLAKVLARTKVPQ